MKQQPTDDTAAFTRCTKCGRDWPSRTCFLGDPDIEIVGYQSSFINLIEGVFMFNHACKGTFSLYAKRFVDLYDGPIFQNRVTGSEACPGYCLYKNNLEPCPAQCDCAYVREVIQIIKKWPKNGCGGS